MHPTFSADETFTYGLISHRVGTLISLDSMDVHPPLYYLLLKLFIIVTTFWTKSVFIKVIFARIFSLISGLLFVYITIKILYMYKIKYYKIFDYILIFMLMPPIVISSTKIRMYSLSALFLVLTFYNLLKFDNNCTNNNVRYLIFSIIFAILSSYTFYFAGLSAGLFIVIFGVKYLCNKRFKSFLELVFSGFILLCAFIPWFPYAIKQVIYHSKVDNGDGNNIFAQLIYSLSQLNPNGLKSIILGIIITIFLFYFIICSFIYGSHNFKYLLIILLINMFITLIISMLLCGKNFQAGVLYPVFTIFSFLLSCTILDYLYCDKKYLNISIIFILVLLLLSFAHIYKNIITYDVPSFTLINNFQKWDNNSSKCIELSTNKYQISKPMTISENAVYLNSIHKVLTIKKYNYSKLSAGLLNSNSNGKLVKSTFTNIKIK